MKNQGLPLLADFYKSTMAPFYFQQRIYGPVTFCLSIHDSPPNRGYLASAGLEPNQPVLLIDTCDTIAGDRKAAEVGREMKRKRDTLKGVRLDRGDIGELSQGVRKVLQKVGLADFPMGWRRERIIREGI